MYIIWLPYPPLTQDNVHRYKDLANSFTVILSQVIGRKLPADFDYHGVPAPWVQMSLLRYIAGVCDDPFQAVQCSRWSMIFMVLLSLYRPL